MNFSILILRYGGELDCQQPCLPLEESLICCSNTLIFFLFKKKDMFNKVFEMVLCICYACHILIYYCRMLFCFHDDVTHESFQQFFLCFLFSKAFFNRTFYLHSYWICFCPQIYSPLLDSPPPRWVNFAHGLLLFLYQVCPS